MGLQDESKWQSLLSNITQDECYLCIFKSSLNLVGELKSCSMIGSTDYRQAWVVNFADKINFVVLHAPSPAHPLQVRLDVINKVAGIIKEYFQLPTLFMGDFNIKEDELEREICLPSFVEKISFNSIMKNAELDHLGPKIDGRPAKTSLRKYYNILLYAGFQQDESQPYDQFFGKFLNINDFELFELEKEFNLKIPGIYEDFLLSKILLDEMEIGELNTGRYSTRLTVTEVEIQKEDKLLDRYRMVVDLNASIENDQKTKGLVSLLPNDFQECLNKYKNLKEFYLQCSESPIKILNFHCNNIIYTGYLSFKIQYQEYHKMYLILDDFLYLQKVMNGFINLLTAGHEGDKILAKVNCEYAISDHLPIMITLKNL